MGSGHRGVAGADDRVLRGSNLIADTGQIHGQSGCSLCGWAAVSSRAGHQPQSLLPAPHRLPAGVRERSCRAMGAARFGGAIIIRTGRHKPSPSPPACSPPRLVLLQRRRQRTLAPPPFQDRPRQRPPLGSRSPARPGHPLQEAPQARAPMAGQRLRRVASALRRCPSGKGSALWLSRSARFWQYDATHRAIPGWPDCPLSRSIS